MSKLQYMNIGGFVLGVPQDKMFEVATLQVDIRPAIKNLQHASIRWSLDTQKAPTRTPSEHFKQHGKDALTIKAQKFLCRKGCRKKFAKPKTRRTHERKYHSKEQTNE